MSDTVATQWPLPKFQFAVEWHNQVLSFQEVSGLAVKVQPIAYRGPGDVTNSVIKLPGLTKFGNVTLKRV